MEVRLLGKMKLYELAKEMDVSSKDLLEQAETTTNHIKELFLNVDLIEHPDTEFAKELLLKFRLL